MMESLLERSMQWDSPRFISEALLKGDYLVGFFIRSREINRGKTVFREFVIKIRDAKVGGEAWSPSTALVALPEFRAQRILKANLKTGDHVCFLVSGFYKGFPELEFEFEQAPENAAPEDDIPDFH